MWRHDWVPWLLLKTCGNHWGSDNKATAILKLDRIWCLSKVNAKLQLLARVWNFEWSLRKKQLWRNRWFRSCIVVPVGLVRRIFQTRSSTNVYRTYPEMRFYAFFQVSVFKVSGLVSGFRSLRFACAFSSFACKRKAKTVTKCSFLCWKRSRVNAALVHWVGCCELSNV